MKVLGTAGHVDHGKSSLVLALTGINPDRLQEEKDRQMTIDLGFAWMTLPGGEEVGIVDVPGHIDFIENMLAGVNGFDAALLVIAADEGIMPQTKEHLAILDLLEVDLGIVALTKVDLVNEKEWLDLVKDDVERILQNTSLSKSPIVPVSAKTKIGLDDLKNELAAVLRNSSAREDLGKPRLPVDRAFTISGFGTIVTGTLKNGNLNVGDEIEILPGSIKGRIRGLQTHKINVQTATPGSRTAVNISGVDVGQISRGDVIAYPETYSSTTMIDVQYRHVPDINVPLKHDQKVKIFIGSAQRSARVRVLGVEEILPGQDGILQLMIDEQVVAERGDHYIIRRPSPGLTMGGGKVIDAVPMRRHRRFNLDLIDGLKSLVEGDPEDLLSQTLMRDGFSIVNDLVKRSGVILEQALPVIEALISSGEIIVINQENRNISSRDLISHRTTWEKLVSDVKRKISDYHDQYPLRFGMPREELKSRLGVDIHLYSLVLRKLAVSGVLQMSESQVAEHDYEPGLTQEQEKLVGALLEQFNANPHASPSVKECIKVVGGDVYTYLVESGELLQVSSDVVFRVETYKEMKSGIKMLLSKRKTITVAEVRDQFNTTRKYALAMMEHLDSIGVTVREGDSRRLVEV